MASDPQPAAFEQHGRSEPVQRGDRKRRGRRGRKRRWPPQVTAAGPRDDSLPLSDEDGSNPEDAGGAARDGGVNGHHHPPVTSSPGRDAEPAGAAASEDSAGEEVVIDPELIRLLQGLNATIDTAHQVLYAAASTQAQYCEAMDRQMAPPPPPPAAPARRRTLRRGPVIAAVAVSVGALAWLGWALQQEPTPLGDALRSLKGAQAAWLPTPEAPPERSLSRVRLGEAPSPALSVPLAAPPPQEAASGSQLAAAGSAAAAMARAREAVAESRHLKDAARTLAGPVGTAIALGLEPPNQPAAAELSVMVQGVPEAASLSSGRRVGADTWILAADQITTAALVTPEGFEPGRFVLEVTFVTSDGTIPDAYPIAVAVDPAEEVAPLADIVPANADAAALPTDAVPPVQETPGTAPPAVAVRPKPGEATRPPPEAPAPPPLDAAAEADLLERGRTLLRHGDAVAARLIFEHAARRGSRSAMTALGQSYDPEHLARLGVRGVAPDKSQAAAWYERAAREADR